MWITCNSLLGFDKRKRATPSCSGRAPQFRTDQLVQGIGTSSMLSPLRVLMVQTFCCSACTTT